MAGSVPRQPPLPLERLVAAGFQAGEGPRGSVDDGVFRQLPLHLERHVAAGFRRRRAARWCDW